MALNLNSNGVKVMARFKLSFGRSQITGKSFALNFAEFSSSYSKVENKKIVREEKRELSFRVDS